MNMQTPMVNPAPVSTAPLKNVSAMLSLIETVKSRPASSSTPFGVMAGPSGYGKSVASTYARNVEDCLYIEIMSYWSRKTFCSAILFELGVTKPKGRIDDMMSEIGRLLGSRRDQVLIIDEADKLVDKNMIEYVRDIQSMTGATVILVGEELLPQKLEEIERFHNRVHAWEFASPCDVADAAILAQLLIPEIAVSEDLLDVICRQTEGRTRRIANTLSNDVKTWVRNHAHTGILTPEIYKGGVFTGRAPVRGR